MKNPLLNKTLACAVILSLNGCAVLDEITQKFNPKQTLAQTKPPANWQAPLPHGGQISNLNEFWQRYPNPILLEMINHAQENAPTLATASANLAEAQANRVRANANLLPNLSANASASRALQQPANSSAGGAAGGFGAAGGGFGGGNVPINTTQIGLQAAWELDLYGANKSLAAASETQEKAAKAGWHEARVAVAAEVATSYFNYLLCQQLYSVQDSVTQSSAETVRLTDIALGAGFSDVGKQALALANLADNKQQTKNQAGQCELEVKNLTALTYLDEPTVRQKLTAAQTGKPVIDLNALFIINEIPAQVLAQRPDVYRAEANLVNAAANVKSAAAARYPKVSLNGSIGWMRLSSDTFKSNGRVWSIGPVSLTLPIFDGGTLAAEQKTAEARYAEAAVKYRGVVQTAIKETENALVNLHNSGEREVDVKLALQGLNTNLQAAETKFKAGFASKLELEEAKRNVLTTQKSALTLQQVRANAWLNLYRAAGGGWDQTMPVQNTNLNAEINTKDLAKESQKIESESNAK